MLEKIPVERPPARVQEGGRLVFFLGAGSLLTVPVLGTSRAFRRLSV